MTSSVTSPQEPKQRQGLLETLTRGGHQLLGYLRGLAEVLTGRRNNMFF